MTVVVFGIDALDPDIVDPAEHPHLALDAHAAIETIPSVAGEPSTHELWPINNTDEDAFRMPASYYEEQGLTTLLDGEDRRAIGVPNYVVEDTEDREHQLRREMGDLFERDPDAKGGHESADPAAFYEQCMEMSMVRTARVRRALRSGRHELVFGYTSGLDLVGHVSHSRPALQERAYAELDDVVAELVADLDAGDELVLVSDHGLQDGLHTDEAMIAATDPAVVDAVEGVTDVRAAVEKLLASGDHSPDRRDERAGGLESDAVREQLEDLGYV